MKIFVQVKANAREEKVEKKNETHFRVLVKAPPAEGKANAAVVRAIAKYFQVAPSRVRIHSGVRSRRKIIEIL